MFNFIKKNQVLIYVAIFLVVWTILTSFIKPEEIVDFIGIENVYLITFLISVFGGFSTFTSLPFLTSIVTFVSGGADPILISLFGGSGLIISDTFFYFVAKYGVKFFQKKNSEGVMKITNKIHKLPDQAVLLFSYLWIAFVPLPNDILMFALAFSKFPYKKIFLIIILGDLTFISVVAYIGKLFF